MTATSVSITVATLQELGHLKSFLGTTIVSAAVIDDVIGIIVLTCVLGASSGEGTGIGGVLIQTALFFLVAVGVGFVFHSIMKWLDARNPHTQRITIVSIAFCFAMAYIAEKYFGIAILPARILPVSFFAPCMMPPMWSAALTSAII